MSLVFDAFARAAGAAPGAVFLSTPDLHVTYREAHARLRECLPHLGHVSGHSIGVSGTSVDSLLLLLAIDRVEACVWLLPRAVGPDDTATLPALSRLAAILDKLPDSEVAPRRPGDGRSGVVIFSSGTTGVPKAVEHTWDTLAARVGRSETLARARWLFPYQISSFAGLQVYLHALLNGSTLSLVPLPETSRADLVRVATGDQVTHISGTPTFFRFLLGAASSHELSGLPVQQLTLGGEIVDQGILDALRRRFPSASITHIYASSEMGVCFSIHDGRAGFPLEYVDRSDLPVRLKVLDGELHVASPHRFQRYLDAPLPPHDRETYFATGDLVELRDDRYHFVGRRENLVNVGGRKVAVGEVEAVILQVPGVHLVRAQGTKSSLAGQLIQADIVLHPGHDASRVREDVSRACRALLEPHKWPRIINFVSELELSGAAKIRRAHS